MSLQKINFSPGSKARQEIKKEFNLPRWEPFRKWFFENFSVKEKTEIQEKFYKYCEKNKNIISFVPWFVANYVEQYISVIERNYKLSNGKILKDIYPPQQGFQIEKGDCNFLAFAKLLEDDTLPLTCKQINLLIEQQNYTNLFLNILGEQLTSLDSRVESVLQEIKKINPTVSLKGKEKVEEVIIPSVQPPPEISEFKLGSTKDLEKFLAKKFKDMNISTLDNKLEENVDYKQVINDEINKLAKYGKWADRPTQRIHYYSRDRKSVV